MCELLPHIFTLTLRQAPSGYFLWHLLFPRKGNLPVRKYGALCCPDFPLLANASSDRTVTVWTANVRRIFEIEPITEKLYSELRYAYTRLSVCKSFGLGYLSCLK